MSYATNATHQALAARMRAAKRVFVTSHWKPDGDAMGSVLAVARALRAVGCDVQAVLAGPVDRTIGKLAADGEIEFVARGPVEPRAGTELAIIVDTGAWSQLEHVAAWLREHNSIAIGFDHHRSGDTVCSARIVDASCASTTQLLVPVIEELGVPFAPIGKSAEHSIAEAIFAGLATDTGWFRFSSADDRVYQIAARLLSLGVDKDRLYRMIEQSDAPGRPLLLGRALRSLQYACNGRAAIMRLGRVDFEETGARVEDTSGLVNEPMTVDVVEVSVLLTQHDAGVVKVSLRSKPPAKRGARFVDVNHVAAHWDGGGHVHAAGAKISGTLDDAAQKVAAALERYFEDAASVSLTGAG